MTVEKMLNMLLSFSPMKDNIKVNVDKELLRPSDVTLQIPDISKFVKATNWKPKIPLEKTLGAILSRRALDILKREKRKTGEKISAILEKAVLNLESHDISNESAVKNKEPRASLSVTPVEEDYRLRTLEFDTNL